MPQPVKSGLWITRHAVARAVERSGFTGDADALRTALEASAAIATGLCIAAPHTTWSVRLRDLRVVAIFAGRNLVTIIEDTKRTRRCRPLLGKVS